MELVEPGDWSDYDKIPRTPIRTCLHPYGATTRPRTARHLYRIGA